MNRSDLKNMSKAQMKPQFWMLVLILVLLFLLCCIPYAGLVIAPALSLSLCKIYLDVTRGRKIEVSDLFSGFKQLGRAWWLNFLICLFTSLWSLLLVIPGIVKSYSYSMAFYILADHPEMTAREALNESKRIMEGHKMELFALHLSYLGWFLLSYVTFGLSLLYVYPYLSTTVANFYNNIKGSSDNTYEAAAEPVYEY